MTSEREGGDPVERPAHYTAHPSGVECIMIVEHFGFSLGNVIKYVWRAGLKGPNALEDLRKARRYLDYEIARLERLERPPSGEQKQRVTALQPAGSR